MKVILLHDIPKIGKKYEVKEVATGYARNVLIPQGKATMATKTALKNVEMLRTSHKKKHAKETAAQKEMAEKLRGQVISVSVKTNEKGHLYAGFSAADVSRIVTEKTGENLPQDAVTLKNPIKETGEYEIMMQIESGGEVGFTLKVEKE